MRTATALGAPSWYREPDDQIALPFPAATPILPVPVERDSVHHAAPVRDRAARFMQALVEVLTGERSARQLEPWMSPSVMTDLRRRLAVGSGGRRSRGRGARIASVHVSMVADDIAEIAGRMVHHGRSRAVAIRLEVTLNARGEKAWRCTALTWG